MDKNKVIINVGRQLGSGGYQVAKLLAAAFDARFYDKELLLLAAKESGFAPEYFEQSDEHKGFLRSLLNLPVLSVGEQDFYTSNLSQESLFKIQSDAIRKAAAEGSCVFVGRCADYVLRDMPECVNVFVSAPLDYRVQQMARRFQCSSKEAARKIEKGEGDRSSYYHYYTGKQWGAAASYHLCVDVTVLGIEGTAAYIADFIRQRHL